MSQARARPSPSKNFLRDNKAASVEYGRRKREAALKAAQAREEVRKATRRIATATAESLPLRPAHAHLALAATPGSHPRE